jgi:hypothetical protein
LAPKTKSKPFLSRFFYQILEQNWIDINNLFTDISDIVDKQPPKKVALAAGSHTHKAGRGLGLKPKISLYKKERQIKSFYPGVIVFHEQMKPHVDRSK